MSRNHTQLNQWQWAVARRAALERDGYRCTNIDCGRAGRLEVHHKKMLSEGGLPFALDNLTTLCRACHIEYSVFGPRLEWRRFLQEQFQEKNQ